MEGRRVQKEAAFRNERYAERLRVNGFRAYNNNRSTNMSWLVLQSKVVGTHTYICSKSLGFTPILKHRAKQGGKQPAFLKAACLHR